VSDDDQLDDYYRELGIEPESMVTKRAKIPKTVAEHQADHEAVYIKKQKIKDS